MDFYNISELFLKKRLVFIINAEDYDKLNFPKYNENLSFELISSNNFYKLVDIYGFSKDDPKLEILINRLNYSNIWKCVIAVLNKKPVGCHWILLPKKYKIFYDSFEISDTDALFCGVFVNPNYRGKHIYNAMQQFAYNMWINNFPKRNIITIVEEKNEPSLKSNLRIGLEIKGVNYLLKYFGKNLLSVYFLPNHKIQVWNALSMKKW